MSDQNQNIWRQIQSFLNQHPSTGVVFLLIPLLPVLKAALPKDDPIGPIAWALIIIVALPPIFLIVRAVIEGCTQHNILRRILIYCFGFCCVALMLSGTAFLALFLLGNPWQNDQKNSETIKITQAEQDRANDATGKERPIRTLSEIFLDIFVRNEVETIIIPEKIVVPEIQPKPIPRIPTVIETQDSSYEDCIKTAHTKGSADKIIECVDLL